MPDVTQKRRETEHARGHKTRGERSMRETRQEGGRGEEGKLHYKKSNEDERRTVQAADASKSKRKENRKI